VAVAYIALGANLGDRLETMRRVVERLASLGVVEAASSVYETAPVGFAAQPPFLNAVVRLRTNVPPGELIRALLAFETELGRVRTFPNAPRTIDLDLLLYDTLVTQSEELTVPHPRLHERAFVLAPLAEIASAVAHPALGARIDELLARLGPITGVDRWAPPSALIGGDEKGAAGEAAPKERRERR
jgi:2-amino-4-hydroxy-6-hydroxymethyldihydropteridine diphosphokinase